MKTTKYAVLDTDGRFFEGEIPGTVCFVPKNLIRGDKLDAGQYVHQGWASRNLKAQPDDRGVGSHLFPDLQRPCDNQVEWARIAERIAINTRIDRL